jgi:O-antigen ligase
MVDIILLGVILGLAMKGETIFAKTPWNIVLFVYGLFTYISLFFGSFFLGSPMPIDPTDPRFADWKNYMVMPLILILVAATVKEPRQMKIIILLVCAATFLLNRSFWDTVSSRDFSHFSYDLRNEGSMGYAGVNGLAAYEAQITTLLVALASFERKLFLRLGYLGLAVFSCLCLMYSLSRGGYLAILASWLFLGLMKQRILLILLLFFLCTWTSLVPVAVKERVLMTYDSNSEELDHSAEVRVDLWNEAMAVIKDNPVFGVGYDTYAYTKHVHGYRDSHNFFVKTLYETGVVGLSLFLWLILRFFLTGLRLFRHARDPFFAALGLGLAGWVLCTAVANFFGDRTYLQIDGLMWVLGGLVSRAFILDQPAISGSDDETVENPIDGVLEVPQPQLEGASGAAI